MVQGVPPTQESLWEAPSCFFTSSSLHFCFFLSSHPLILTFTTRNPRCSPRGYNVPLHGSRAVWAPCCFCFFSFVFCFFLFCTSHMYFSILGSPFSTPPQRESPRWKAFLLIMWAVTLKHYSHTQSEWHNMVSWQVKNTICASELVCDRVSDSKLRYFIAASV